MLADQTTIAWELAAEYVDAFKSISDQWDKTLANILSSKDANSLLSALESTFDRIYEEMLTNLISRSGLGESLAKLEMSLTGGKASAMAEAQQRAEMIRQRMNESGDYIAMRFQSSGMAVGDYIATRMQVAGMQSGGMTGVPGYSYPGLESMSYNNEALQGQPSAGTSAAFAGVNAVMGTYQAYQAGGKSSAIGYGVGSGVGAGVGAIVGSIIPGVGTAIGAMIGQQLGGMIGQSVAGSDKDKPEPKTESLRDVLEDTINRGSFQSAAQITYNIQNTYSMGFALPDREEIRRIIDMIEREKGAVDRNTANT
jgi:hypothetical protein